MAGGLGIDSAKDGDRLKVCMNEEMSNIHRDIFRLLPTTPPPSASQPALSGGAAIDPAELNAALVRLDADSLRSCIDKTDGGRVKLNFDINEFESESITVKTVGNKIEVHAQKKSIKGDEERSESFSRVYELPTSSDVDPSHVTSSIFEDGVLTVELPFSDALDVAAAPWVVPEI